MPENNLKFALERMSQDLKRIQFKNIDSNSHNDSYKALSIFLPILPYPFIPTFIVIIFLKN